jgi:hypothetical protein
MLTWIKKHPWLAVFLGLGLIAAILFIVSLCVPIVGDLCTYDEHGKAEQCAQHHLGPFVLFWLTLQADTHNGFVTAISTALLTYITYLLVNLGREDSKTQRAQLRAYVSVKPMRASLNLDDHLVHVLADSENTGQTPSFMTQVLWDVSVMEYPLTVRLRYQGDARDLTKPVPTFVLYPHQKSMSVKPYRLTDDDIAKIRAKTHALYAYGRITYLDAFKTEQWGEFCAYIDGETYDIWRAQARNSPDRQPVPAPFKFTQNNNTASF